MGNNGTLNNSRFSGNKALSYYSGGAVYWYYDYGVISNSVFETILPDIREVSFIMRAMVNLAI